MLHVGIDKPQEFKALDLSHCTHQDHAVQLCQEQTFRANYKRSFRLPRDEIVPWLKEGRYFWAAIMPLRALEAPIHIPSCKLIPQAGGNSRYGSIVVGMTVEEALAMYTNTVVL